jgi:hypothetical protein
MIPTYVVIPVKDNLPLTSALVAQLRDQVLVAAPWSSASPTADDSWMDLSGTSGGSRCRPCRVPELGHGL